MHGNTLAVEADEQSRACQKSILGFPLMLTSMDNTLAADPATQDILFHVVSICDCTYTFREK